MRRPRAIALVVLALIWPAPAALAQAPEVHSKHFVGGQPTGTPASNDLIIRDSYALSSNDTTKFADWVAYRLTAAEVVGILDLEREWRADPFLDEDETLEPNPDAEDEEAASPPMVMAFFLSGAFFPSWGCRFDE